MRVSDFPRPSPERLLLQAQAEEIGDLPTAEREAVEKHLRFARSLRIETLVRGGKDVPQTVVDFARHNQVSQIFVARSRLRLYKRLFGKDYAEAIVRGAYDLQVTVVADRTRRHGF